MTDQFDELHVVSDLHIGGLPGFQIFNQGARLAALIRKLTCSHRDSLALVLNGDIVDFLAEPNAQYFDPAGAIGKLESIWQRSEFSPVLSALQKYVATEGRTLVLVLGNHDVELALPPVRDWFVQRLTSGDAAARGRVVVALDGAGYRCVVGGKNVLCVHGNEVDSWNVVDHGALAWQSRALLRGDKLPPWDANAGTRMVVDVMNHLKKRFPMIDLLQPEFRAAAPVMVALDPTSLSNIAKVLRITTHIPEGDLLIRPGLLSAEDRLPDDAHTENHVILKFAEEHFGLNALEEEATGLLRHVYQAITHALHDPLHSTDELVGNIEGWLSPERRPAQLRKHLKRRLVDERSFDIVNRDDQFKHLDAEVSDSVHYLIAGHTHLERSIKRQFDDCYYFNSGTWTRLIELTHEILDSDAEFEQVYEAFGAGDIRSLDEVHNLGTENKSLVLIRPTVVSIVHEADVVYGELRHARMDGSLKPVAGSRRV